MEGWGAYALAVSFGGGGTVTLSPETQQALAQRMGAEVGVLGQPTDAEGFWIERERIYFRCTPLALAVEKQFPDLSDFGRLAQAAVAFTETILSSFEASTVGYTLQAIVETELGEGAYSAVGKRLFRDDLPLSPWNCIGGWGTLLYEAGDGKTLRFTIEPRAGDASKLFQVVYLRLEPPDGLTPVVMERYMAELWNTSQRFLQECLDA